MNKPSRKPARSRPPQAWSAGRRAQAGLQGDGCPRTGPLVSLVRSLPLERDLEAPWQGQRQAPLPPGAAALTAIDSNGRTVCPRGSVSVRAGAVPLAVPAGAGRWWRGEGVGDRYQIVIPRCVIMSQRTAAFCRNLLLSNWDSRARCCSVVALHGDSLGRTVVRTTGSSGADREGLRCLPVNAVRSLWAFRKRPCHRFSPAVSIRMDLFLSSLPGPILPDASL